MKWFVHWSVWKTGIFQNKFMNITEYFLVVSVTVEVISHQQSFCIISISFYTKFKFSYYHTWHSVTRNVQMILFGHSCICLCWYMVIKKIRVEGTRTKSHTSMIGINKLINALAVEVQMSTTMDHVRLGQQASIKDEGCLRGHKLPDVVRNFPEGMLSFHCTSILILGARITNIAKFIFLVSMNAPTHYTQVLHTLSNVGRAFRVNHKR